MARIEKLPDTIDLAAIRDEWIAIGLSTEPDDEAEADRSIDLVYRAAGLEPPGIRIWLDSPLAGTFGYALLERLKSSVGASVGASVWDSVWDSVEDSVWDSVEDSVGTSVWASVGASVRASVGASVRASVRASVGTSVWASVWASVEASVGASVRASVWASVRASVRDSVGRACYGQHDANWLAFYWTFRDLVPETARLAGLWGMARASGWFWPSAKAVIFTRRPVELHRDGLSLHRDGGPALLYRDGFALWRLHGVTVPRWLAEERAEAIDPRKILEIDNAEVRREFGRKVGMDRVLYSLGSECINRCGEYELLLLDLKDGRRRPYLKMANPSAPEVYHCEGVHPDCKTVQDALNFRNGLGIAEIDDINGVSWFQQGDVILRPKGAKKFKPRPVILT